MIPSDNPFWRGLVPFWIAAAAVLGAIGWQVAVLAGQLDRASFGLSTVQQSIVNILGCLVVGLGLYLWHRTAMLNRTLRQSRQVASGLQEMQSTLRRRNRELEMESRTDSITGVGNRLLLGETLDFEIQRCDRYGDPLSMALVEIGGLRRLHVRLGRRAVDDAVRMAAARIRSFVPPSDWVFRWNEGEFVVLWLNADAVQARLDVVRIQEVLRDGCLENGLDLPVSVGGTSYCPGEGADRFLARADLAKRDIAKGGVCYLPGA